MTTIHIDTDSTINEGSQEAEIREEQAMTDKTEQELGKELGFALAFTEGRLSFGDMVELLLFLLNFR